MAAVSCISLKYEVVLLLPFHCTAEVEMKLPPFTTKVKAAPPALAEDGESELIDGTGFGGGGGGLEVDVPPQAVSPTIPSSRLRQS
jgi:hypothetical protein